MWRGVHVDEREPVAVKFAGSLSDASRPTRRRFREEVRAHAGLEHPGIVRVYDHGRLGERAEAVTDGDLAAGTPYLIMEYAPEGTLADRPPTGRWSELRGTLLGLLDALAHAHARDVIHRDLKPSNILRGRRQGTDALPTNGGPDEEPRAGMQPKLADFGLAHLVEQRVADRGESLVCPTAGTPLFMAPEQFEGEWRQFGPWTDLYQLGAIAWQWICGEPPFPGSAWFEIAVGHIDEPLPAFGPEVPVPEGVAGWLHRMLAKDPARRFQRAADAAWRLRQLPERVPGSGDDRPAGDEAEGIALQETQSSDEAPTQIERPPPTRVLGETLRLWSPVREEVAAPTATGDAPPIPESWRIEGARADPELLVGAGRGLVGLRQIPFVGRRAERDRLWALLRRCAADEQPSVALIEGRSGAGKSRLARWIARRAHEVGAANVVVAPHTRQDRPGDGVARMLETAFNHWNLPEREAVDLVRERLRVRSRASGEWNLDAIARGLVAVTGSTDDRERDLSQYTILGEWLEILAERRPLLVWLDDIQWGAIALDCVRYFLERDPQIPVFVVMTARVGERRPAIEDRLASIEKHAADPRHATMRLSALDRSDHAELVRRLLPLAEPVVEQVCDRTEGNPLFAVQLIRDWVARDRLEVGPEGFRLAGSADEELPSAITDVWARRIEDTLGRLDGVEPAEGERALQIAAALGRRVNRREWEAVCRRRGIAVAPEFVEALIEGGLAHAERDGWSFVHGMLVEAIAERARKMGHWRADHRCCADVLEEMYRGQTEATAERRVDHLVEAGEEEAALAPRDEARDLAIAGRGNIAIRQMLERRLRMMDRLGIPAEDRRRVKNWIQRAGVCRRTGDREEARRWLDRAEAAVEANGWEREGREVAKERAQFLLSEWQLEPALRQFERVEAEIDGEQFPRRRAEILGRKSEVLGHLGRYDEARAAMDEACAIFERVGPERYALFSEQHRAKIEVQAGHLEEAQRRLWEVRDRASRSEGRKLWAITTSKLGECALMVGRPSRARERYREALEASSELDNIYIEADCREGLVAVELYDGAVAEAESQLRELQRWHAERGLMAVSGSHYERVRAALLDAGCAAVSGDWERFDVALERLGLPAGESETLDVESFGIWMLELVGDLAAEAGERERAHTAWREARRRWDERNRSEAAERVAAKIDG